MAAASAFYGLKYQSRCIAAQHGQSERHRFFVGTRNIKESNELHLIEFDEDANEVVCQQLYSHPAEIHSISPAPAQQHQELLFTTYRNRVAASSSSKDGNNLNSFRASLWRATGSAVDAIGGGSIASSSSSSSSQSSSSSSSSSSSESSMSQLTHVLDLGDANTHSGEIRRVVWNPIESVSQVVTMDDTAIRLWDMNDAATRVTGTDGGATSSSSSASSLVDLNDGSWDPHHPASFVTVNQTDVRVWDVRAMTQTQCIARAHNDTIRSVDYNPNKPYNIATAGDDRRCMFWDLRHAARPLKILSGHTAGISQVVYNYFHDQLLLTAGTDHRVNLWTVVSISSAPLGDLEDHTANEREGDKLIQTYTEHEDSVYSVAWSSSEAWVFASLSFDGRVAISHVSPAEKYKILL